MTADLSALIARLEAAEVGSRELDGAVARLFGWHRVEPRFSRNKHGGWIAPEDFIGLYSDGSPKLDGLHGTTIHRNPPRLTQSLDAALALAERVHGEARALDLLQDGLSLHDASGIAIRDLPRLLCSFTLRAKQGEGE